MRTEFVGSITTVRDAEDCIRATKKYTKGAFRSPATHPIQGGEIPSRVMTEYYEVYPDLELSWDMDARDAFDWLWGDVAHIDVLIRYDYRANKGKVIVHGNAEVVGLLYDGIPNFREALAALETLKQKSRPELLEKVITDEPERKTA